MPRSSRIPSSSLRTPLCARILSPIAYIYIPVSCSEGSLVRIKYRFRQVLEIVFYIIIIAILVSIMNFLGPVRQQDKTEFSRVNA